jgi:ABC-type dipeptide/oligopeptide/nickel transport system permease component
MNLLKVNFDELYRRHLCRHSQFGINVLHLVAVIGIYFSLLGIAFALPATPWVVGTVLGIYVLLLAANIPFRVWVTTVLTIGLLLSPFLAIPRIPLSYVWIYVVMILAWHRFQIWNHRVYDHSHPMDAFSEKYRKGFLLFVLLAVYELPILLNYLVFDRQNWQTHELHGPMSGAGSSTPPAEPALPQESLALKPEEEPAAT